MQHRVTLLALAWLGLSGCVANTYCLDEQAYSTAESAPPLVGVEQLKLPQSATALRIPPPPANPVPYGQMVKDEEGEERARCLDMPPAMASLSEPLPPAEGEEAVAPAPAPAPAEEPKSKPKKAPSPKKGQRSRAEPKTDPVPGS